MTALYRRLPWQVQIGAILAVVAVIAVAGFLALQQFQAGSPGGSTGEGKTADVGGTAQIIPQGDRPFGINVIGEGEVIVSPDQATVIVGVEARAETAEDAAGQTGATVEAVITALGALGVTPDDIQTTAVNLNPIYPRDPETRGTAAELTPVGYVSANTLTVTVRDITRASQTVDAALGAGANSLRSITFTLADDSAAKERALRLATLDAARKARSVAESLQGSVRGLIALNEEFVSVPQPLAARGPVMALEAAGPSVPVAPGELRVRAVVHANFAFE